MRYAQSAEAVCITVCAALRRRGRRLKGSERMERLVVKCTPKTRQETGCIIEGKCEHTTRNGYCGYHDCFNEKGMQELLNQLDRLGQLEDEAGEREQGCEWCNSNDCETCDSMFCTGCLAKERYEPKKYCSFCGRRLVE